jgi:hypothetical protein
MQDILAETVAYQLPLVMSGNVLPTFICRIYQLKPLPTVDTRCEWHYSANIYMQDILAETVAYQLPLVLSGNVLPTFICRIYQLKPFPSSCLSAFGLSDAVWVRI